MIDVRLAVRALRASPSTSLLAIVTLALAIGTNAAIFSVVERVLVRDLPYPDAARIVRLAGPHPQSFVMFAQNGPELYPPELKESRAFAALGIVATGGVNLTEAEPERLRAAAVTPDFFAVMGIRPLRGHWFTAADAAGGAIAVVSDALWRRRFGEDPAIIGRGIDLNARVYTIVGVAPGKMMFPEAIDVWIPIGADQQIFGAVPTPHVFGRLAPGVTARQATDAVAAVLPQGSVIRPDSVEVRSLQNDLLGNVRPLSLLISSAAGVILLIACINVANLLLSRVVSRDREFGIRRALGASSARLLRPLLLESMLLSAAACLTALPAAGWTLPALRRILPADLEGIADLRLDGRMVAFATALALTTTILFAVAPAVSLWRRSVIDALRTSSSVTDDRSWRRFRSALVVAEIGMSLVLLIGTGAIIANVSRLAATRTGASRGDALTITVALPASRYDSNEKVVRFVEQATRELHGLHDVQAVGATNELPGSAADTLIQRPVKVEGLALPAMAAGRLALALTASPEYFDALGIRLLAGRAFSAMDRPDRPRVAIVSQSYVNALHLTPAAALRRKMLVSSGRGFPGRDRPDIWAEIVGVVDDVKLHGPDGEFTVATYEPFAVSPPRFSPVHLIVAADPDSRALLPDIRAALARTDPDLPLFNVKLFGEVQAEYLAGRRFAMRLFLAFGGLAVAMTAIGLFGVIGYLVQRRTREIGIRLSIGATPTQIRRDILAQGLAHAIGGTIVGLGAVALVGPFVSSRVPGFWNFNVVTCLLPIGFIAAVALVATLAPARRAMRVDPIRALRAD
jgi:putative ABC transport system permease protein